MKIDHKKYPLPGRLREHTSPNYYLPAEQFEKLPECYPPLIEKIDWAEMFDDGKPPAALDIGCGKGDFLLEFAVRNPDLNVLGIEVRQKITEWLNKVIEGESIRNCGVIWYSAVNGLPFIDDNSIDKIFYLFPDPWFKKKHRKRRLFNHSFLDECARILKPEGKLFLATDVPDVDVYQREVIVEHGKFEYNYIEADEEWQLPETNKEMSCKKRGVDYTRMVCELK